MDAILFIASVYKQQVEKILMEAMEFHDNSSNNNYMDMCELKCEDSTLQGDYMFDFPKSLWDANQIDDNWLDSMVEQTPVKDCTNFGYEYPDNSKKVFEEYRDCFQVKRRRMLQYTYDSNDTSVGHEQSNIDMKVESTTQCELLENRLCHSQWDQGFIDDRHDFDNDRLNQPLEELLENCYNNGDLGCTPCEMKNGMSLDDQIGISEILSIQPEMEPDLAEETAIISPSIAFKGMGSYIKTSMESTASVAYPFTLIKPCGEQGGLTLKDINQRIHAPLLSRSKHMKNDDPSTNYPTSAFSGKPVVVKTKIHTEGGKGSITIMRTKG